MSHVWEKLQDTDHEQLILSDTESMMGEKLPFLKELKPWIAHFLQLEDVRILVCDKESRDQSALIESVLNLVQSLALFGYYSNPKEITVVRANPFFFFLPLPFFHHLSLLLQPQLVGHIYALLDGTTDVLSWGNRNEPDKAWSQKERFLKTELSQPVFDIKLAALQIVDTFMNFRLLTIMKQFLYDFKTLADYDDADKSKFPYSFPFFSC